MNLAARLIRFVTSFAWKEEIRDRGRVDWIEEHQKILLTHAKNTCLYETFPLYGLPATEEWMKEYRRDERFCHSYRELIDLTQNHPIK